VFLRTVWAQPNLDSCLNFTGRDLHRGSAKFGLVKFAIASSAFFHKKTTVWGCFLLCCKGSGTWMVKSLPAPPYDAFMVATWLCWRKASRF